MVGTNPTVLPWDLMALDHLLIWSLSLMISGSLAAMKLSYDLNLKLGILGWSGERLRFCDGLR